MGMCDGIELVSTWSVEACIRLSGVWHQSILMALSLLSACVIVAVNNGCTGVEIE